MEEVLSEGDYELPSDLHSAWVFSKIKYWLDNLHERQDISQLKRRLDKTEK